VTTSKTYDVLGNLRSLIEPLDSGENINRVTQYAYAWQTQQPHRHERRGLHLLV